MSFAISIKAPSTAGARLRAYWDRFGRFEQTPSMAALAYPPHVTFAVYEHIEEDRLRDAVHRVFSRQSCISLRFAKISRFEKPNLVFWAAPDRSEALLRVHAAIHGLIDPASCDVKYRPGHWLPHCTLATRVIEAKKQEAVAFADQPIEVFDVTFDWADCVQFPPVKVIEELRLQPTV